MEKKALGLAAMALAGAIGLGGIAAPALAQNEQFIPMPRTAFRSPTA
jgi:hypothetical protein